MAKQQSLKGMPSSEFPEWLENLCSDYRRLCDTQKNEVLDKLISHGRSSQLNYLSTVLPQLLYRDFLRLLPREITYRILKFLSVNTLLVCSCVCKSWCAIVHQLPLVWWTKARQMGATSDAYTGGKEATKHYKTLCLTVMKILGSCNEGTCFTEYLLERHSDRVMAVGYYDGKFCTGSDDQTVIVWEASTGEMLAKINTHTVCYLRLSSEYVYTASFDGTAACWEISSGQLVHHLIGHTSAVFSIDVHDSETIVTGSSDRTVKLWSSCREPYLLETLEGFHHEWVTKVQFLSSESPQDKLFASVDKNVCHVWNWDGQCRTLHSISQKPNIQITSFWHRNANCFYLCNWNDKQLSSEVHMYSFSHGNLSLSMSVLLGKDAPLRCHLLGAGQKFAVFTSSSEINQVCIFSFGQSRIVAKIAIPLCRSTRNGATLTLGNSNWLDGLNRTTVKETFLAACQQNSCNMLLLKWKKR